jgi:Ca-activated chloride channel homolog
MKNIINLFIALTLIGSIFIFSKVLHSTSTGTIKGTVIQKSTNQPVDSVLVQINYLQLQTYTNANGYFEFKSLPYGNYDLQFSKKGFVQFDQKNVRLSSAEKELTINMVGILKIVADSIRAENTIVAIEEELEISDVAIMPTNGNSVMKSVKSMGATSYYMTDAIYNGYVEDDGFNTESYDRIYDNIFKQSLTDPVSTFSIDVDAASYSNLRRFVTAGQKPPADAIRIEEMVNYFSYNYKNPNGNIPFSINTEVAECPWNPDHQLIHIGLQGKMVDYDDLRASNLVFLVDVSGSMSHEKKLPLVKKSLMKMLEQLTERDRIAIVVYAGAAGLVLPSTPANEKQKIMAALNNLKAGGSTAGGAGIKLAYKVALENFIEDGNNRVILATDGDFNVGASSDSEMVRLIEENRKSGVFITVAGFGMGNYKDSKMEKIANKGNGNYFYIDQEKEADKVFGKELLATLFTIAKDVKIQVEFNPAKVKSYRLIGYVNRKLNNEDFENDKKDAGELGAGHTVTALYEIELNENNTSNGTDYYEQNTQTNRDQEYKYMETRIKPDAKKSKELVTVRLRYKEPDGTKSKLIESTINTSNKNITQSSENFRWSAGVALFGMLLRDSEYKGTGDYDMVLSLAKGAKGNDVEGYRQEFIEMVSGFVQALVSR